MALEIARMWMVLSNPSPWALGGFVSFHEVVAWLSTRGDVVNATVAFSSSNHRYRTRPVVDLPIAARSCYDKA